MSKINTYKVRGMHCASCASIIEKTFKKTDGVHSVQVNYGTETAKIEFDESKTNIEDLSQKIEPPGAETDLSRDDQSKNQKDRTTRPQLPFFLKAQNEKLQPGCVLYHPQKVFSLIANHQILDEA
jgi:copper chaperone CopZ